MSKEKPHLIDHWPLPLSPLNTAYRMLDDGNMLADRVRRKVCIYGAGKGKGEAPLDDPSWEVWALNLVPPFDAAGRLRCDRWFDLHQREAQTAEDLRWIAACPVPIYLPPDLQDASPRAVRYPLAEIETKLGVNYWACTFAYQIALVLHEGIATDLGLYGVELAYGTTRERTVEWANVAYWVGRARERGLRIHTPATSTLECHPGRYGFEYAAEIDGVNRYVDFVTQAEEYRRGLGLVDIGG